MINMLILEIIFGYVFLVYFGWFWFIAVMGLKAAKDAGTLTKGTQIAAYPMAILGYLYDITVLNILGSIYLLDFPKLWKGEFTLTAHLTRLKTAPGLKGHKARIICRDLLDPFQIGGHCR